MFDTTFVEEIKTQLHV